MLRHWLAVAIALLWTAPASAAGIQGKLYVLGIALNQEGNIGGWRQVGRGADWKETIAGTMLGDKIYSVESNGVLYVTDPATATWRSLGAADFAGTKFMTTVGNELYTIEGDGCLYHIKPADGSWEQVGDDGLWKSTLAAVALADKLYTIETNGRLIRTDVATGRRRPIGEPEFAGTRMLFAAENLLYTIETDGSLYQVSPDDGSWTQLGAAAAWKNAFNGAVANGRIFTVESDDHLYCTDPRSGSRRQVGDEYGNTRLMFAGGDRLYTLEKSGALYHIQAKPGLAIDTYNWCVDEFERLWRTQAGARSQGMQVRKILGDGATKAAILGGFDWLRQEAGPDDLAVVYIGAHGATDPRKGWGIDTSDNQQFWGAEMKRALARLKCPALVLIETCGSGGFAEAHPDGDPPVPVNVTAICACAANQTTLNPLDIAYQEALYGRGDFDRDGDVELGEMLDYIERRYREWWPKPVERSNEPIIVKSPRMADTLSLTEPPAKPTTVFVKGRFYTAVNLGNEAGKYKVRVLGWSQDSGRPWFLTDSVERSHIWLAGDGPPLLVEQAGDWFPARQVSVKGDTTIVRPLNRSGVQWEVKSPQIRHPFAGAARYE